MVGHAGTLPLAATDAKPTALAEDHDLIWWIAGGEREALRALYERHADRVFAFIRSRLNDAAESEDLLHEVMLEVWRGAGHFKGRSRALTWMLGMPTTRSSITTARSGRTTTPASTSRTGGPAPSIPWRRAPRLGLYASA